MGGCLSFRRDEATKIADLEEILFKMVKQDHLTLAQAMCLGNSLYLEVKTISSQSYCLPTDIGEGDLCTCLRFELRWLPPMVPILQQELCITTEALLLTPI